MNYADGVFRAHLPQGGEGASLAAHVRQAIRSGAKVPDEWLQVASPEATPPPEGLEFIWGVFLDLNSTRGGNGFGPNPLSWGEIESYCRLTKVELEMWELDLLVKVDRTWLKVQAEHAKAEADRKKQSPSQSD